VDGVVEVLNLNINWLMAQLENAADTTPKRYDPFAPSKANSQFAVSSFVCLDNKEFVRES
jgi:hypothetical protein